MGPAVHARGKTHHPVFRETRIPVTVILDHLMAEGMGPEKVLEGFPMLSDEDSSAAINLELPPGHLNKTYLQLF
ncbi:MAG: DUF433 domain-containing protein [Candidatus Omnitrophica bacterium]|nr:DUF433 domain-containing protein [Candidatus Omnitrophota bacterium]